MSIQQERRTADSDKNAHSVNRIMDWNKLSKSPVVGIIGGGQLAQMLYQSAISLGLEAHLFASVYDEAAPKYFRDTTRASSEQWTPPELYHFAQKCDVVTFDHELVSPSIVRELEKRGCLMLPSASTLEISANKANQRQQLSDRGYPLPLYQVCSTESELISFGERFGWPMVIKPATGGYDGRGVFIVDDPTQVSSLIAELSQHLPLIAEPFLKLDSEASVIVVRSSTGECKTYPAVKTVQIDGMCREVTSPSQLDDELEDKARKMATEIAEQFDAVGVLAVEFFICEGKLLVNELAPRPHNSGHITIEANMTSQFENHLRAVLGLPLGNTSLRVSAAAMVNLIASSSTQNVMSKLSSALAVDGVSVHLYSKSSRKGRKIGHVTATATNVESALTAARQAVDSLSAFEEPEN